MATEAREAYGIVVLSFWRDPDVKRLPIEMKALLLYYFTGPHSNMVGLYYCPPGYASAETGLPVEEVREALGGSLSPFVTYDETTDEVLVHRLARYRVGDRLTDRDNRTKACTRLLREAHSNSLIERFLALYPGWDLSTFREAPSEAPSEGGHEARSSNRSRSSNRNNGGGRASAREASDPDSDAEASTGPDPVPDELERAATRIIVATNQAQEANDAVPPVAGAYIQTSGGSRSTVIGWLKRGLSEERITAAVARIAASKEDDPIRSMNYFDRVIQREIESDDDSDRRPGARKGKGRRGASPEASSEAASKYADVSG